MVRSYSVGTAVGVAVLAALLVTGCGTDDDGAETSPSSAAPSAAATSVAPSPGTTPADYVPASLEGPAQNVPKPVMPALAKEESRDGAQAFLDYWSDAMWYAYQTGDTSYARDIISPHCDACHGELDDVASVYGEGNWLIGGRPVINLQEKVLSPAHDGIYKPRAVYTGEGGRLVENGEVTQGADAASGDSTLVYIDFDEIKWVYITMAPVPGE